jgi:hypothetical protein
MAVNIGQFSEFYKKLFPLSGVFGALGEDVPDGFDSMSREDQGRLASQALADYAERHGLSEEDLS